MKCLHGHQWPECPWGCTMGRPEDKREGKWSPTAVPDLEAAADELGTKYLYDNEPPVKIAKLRQARQKLWDLVSAWEVRPEMREAAAQLQKVLEEFDE